MNPEKQALAVFWRHKGFWAAQGLAFAAWAGVAVSWFWLPDFSAWGVALAVIQALPAIVFGLWLIAATLFFYQKAHVEENVGLGEAYREGLRRSRALLAWLVFFGVGLWLTLRPQLPRWTWLVVPLLLLPLAAQITAEGVRGLFRMVWSARYFAQFALLAAAGVILPTLLVGWHPSLPGVALQTASLAARFTLAYLLAITSWLILASLLAVPARSTPTP